MLSEVGTTTMVDARPGTTVIFNDDGVFATHASSSGAEAAVMLPWTASARRAHAAVVEVMLSVALRRFASERGCWLLVRCARRVNMKAPKNV